MKVNTATATRLIQMLDSHHRMGLLGPGITKYQRHAPEYKHAKANLLWRIYDLGYSFERFGSIDSVLAGERPWPGRHAESGHMDGYGRKYCRIATCELAGYRDDLDLLRSEWNTVSENWHFVDVDPSFPEEPTRLQLVLGDVLEIETQLGEWIVGGPDLTFEDLCEADQIGETRGPWVLLDGYISQYDRRSKRQMFTFLRGILVAGPNPNNCIPSIVADGRRIDGGHLDPPFYLLHVRRRDPVVRDLPAQ